MLSAYFPAIGSINLPSMKFLIWFVTCVAFSISRHLSPVTRHFSMNYLQLIGLIVCVASLAGCETTEATGKGNAEAKRLAALEQRRQTESQMDESQKNLWNAQQDLLNRDV